MCYSEGLHVKTRLEVLFHHRSRSLTGRIGRQVAPPIRERGRAYHRNGAVKILSGDEEIVRAAVRGRRSYEVLVRVDLGDRALTCSCTCPYFTGNGRTCKHIWATLLEAEQRRLLGNARRLDERPVSPFPDDLSVDEDGGDGRDDLDGAAVEPTWEERIADVSHAAGADRSAPPPGPAPEREVLYVIDVPSTLKGGGLSVEAGFRQRKKDGRWSKLKARRWTHAEANALADHADRRIVSLLIGGQDRPAVDPYGGYVPPAARLFHLPPAAQRLLVRQMCATKRCMLRTGAGKDDFTPLRFEEGDPWRFHLALVREEKTDTYSLRGTLRRGNSIIPLSEPALLTSGGIVVIGDVVAPLEIAREEAFLWISLLRRHPEMTVPAADAQRFLEKLLALPGVPRLDLPKELRYREMAIPPRPSLLVSDPLPGAYAPLLTARLVFDYDGIAIDAGTPGDGVYRPNDRRLLRRDPRKELAAHRRLLDLGLTPHPARREASDPHYELPARRLSLVVGELTKEEWRVEVDGKQFRRASSFEMNVKSEIDWFELHGSIDFDGQTAPLPELLRAMKRGEKTVRLGDGTFGILPEEWLARFGTLTLFGESSKGDELVRYKPTQVALLNALLAVMPEVKTDRLFRKARAKIERFDGIKARKEPASFRGTLRDYQRDGLGWLHFLRGFGFGGCLADDMGLGKTVQVLALLEDRRRKRRAGAKAGGGRVPPSLVVVPRSLVFNWRQEAERFTPKLRVLDHTGIDRFGRDMKERKKRSIAHFEKYDLILTTYGTLRRDAPLLRDFRFDYAVLDEAQAVKNASTATAKAARLLCADNRLALSGTPIENHLGELWSLFEYLNPGMLGSGKAGSLISAAGTASREVDETTRTLLGRALRPYILRRTKEQVASDLPKRLEQTIYCTLETKQRRLYDELRDHYRALLLERIDSHGLNKSKIQVLEALLRLRQAACHPRLVHGDDGDWPSAKLDMLLPRLTEVIEEGHKALVFSQFVSMLRIVREELDRQKITYEYLDGQTRKRRPRIERFQNDPDCRLFLISLKAGGLGLNLTAADYVFLLDPWWNPAVEAQAIDRAHRIGQTRAVFAYRLIAKDTVEEKVLELQNVKRDLADAIINADNSVIRNLTREDLETLLE